VKHRFLILFFILTCSYFPLRAQVDTLILKNNDIIVGEIKSMDRGVLTIETPYSDSDFKIEWEGIREIYSTTFFLLTLSDGRRYNGTIRSDDQEKVIINDVDIGQTTEGISQIVYLNALEDEFWRRLNASIDFGYSFTKANNLKQVNLRSALGFINEKWSLDASYDHTRSTQDEVAPTKRTDIGITFRKILQNDWYLPVNISFLSNTEQKLDLRTNAKMGVGKYLIHTNNSYWGVGGGASYVNEIFSSEDPDRNSWEIYAGTELNLYDVGDFSLLTKISLYRSVTEKGRWRSDLNLDTKYDLPLDFYIRVGFSMNYDNQSVEGTANTDYIFQTSFGWEW
jgi:hypothetical protein